MERGDGYWASSPAPNKGWKTRREQQDAYRKALDDQIEQRKNMENQQRRGTREPEPPKIQDPVQHLMPWVNQPSADAAATAQQQQNPAPTPTAVPAPIPAPSQAQAPPSYSAPQVPPSYAAPQPQPQQVYANHPHPQAPANYYYVANAGPPPQEVQLQAAIPAPPVAAAGAYFYGPPPTIPPPPPFSYAGVPYALPTGGALTTTPQPQYIPLPVPPPPPAEKETTSEKSSPSPRANSPRSTKGDPKIKPVKPSVKLGKVHVSQSSEDLDKQSYDQYREELAKQVEERKKKEEERQKLEQEEEERLQKKFLEDQIRIQQQYQEEERQAIEREENDRKMKAELFKSLENAKKSAEQELHEKRRSHGQPEVQKGEETARSTRMTNQAVQRKTSPSRYYNRDPNSTWVWESIPVPTHNKGFLDPDRDVAETSARDTETSATPQTFQSQSPRDSVGSGRSLSTSLPPQYGRGGDVTASRAGDAMNNQQSATPMCSSRTITLGFDPNNNSEGYNSGTITPSGMSKSSEEVPSYGQGQGGVESNEEMICPRCCRSFSSVDIKCPRSAEERQKIINCLDNIKRQLKAEQERIIRGGFQWKR